MTRARPENDPRPRARLVRFEATGSIEKYSTSCVRYLSKTHFVLRLPRNLHMEVHKVLCLPRNQHMELHKALRLPRNLQFKKQVKTLTTMEGRFEHDPSMTRDRLAIVVPQS